MSGLERAPSLPRARLQWLELAAHDGLVAGSSPAGPTTHSRNFAFSETSREKAAFAASCDVWYAPTGLWGERAADVAALSLAAKILFLARGSAPIVAAEEDRVVWGFQVFGKRATGF